MKSGKRLQVDQLLSVEAVLAEIVASHSEGYDFSGSELLMLDQRVAEEKLAFSDSGDIAKLFGKPFSVFCL